MSRFTSNGLQQTGYGNLWGDPAFPTRPRTSPNKGLNFGGAGDDLGFMRRFGIGRVVERNDNLLRTFKDPHGELAKVNNEIQKIGNGKVQRYKDLQNDLRRLGFGEEEVTARADAMIARELENDLALLQLEYPYALGGAEAGGWDPITAIIRSAPGAEKLPITFGLAQSTKGFGTRA